jgi:hypothetical protein
MARRKRHRRPISLLRLCLLALLSLGLALQPLLAAVGELHELAHDPTGTHAVLDGGDVAKDGAAKNDPAKDAGDKSDPSSLHLLLEYAHCCGQMPLSAWPAVASTTVFPVIGDPPQAEPQLPLQARAFIPFRPPIVA